MLQQTKLKPTIVFVDHKECFSSFSSNKQVCQKFKVLTATNGKDALKLIFEKKPDIVVSEVVVEKGDIFYIMKEMKRNPETRDIPVIALTTLCSVGDKQEVVQEGACDYLLKYECNPQKLVKKIEEVLKNKK